MLMEWLDVRKTVDYHGIKGREDLKEPNLTER